MTAAQQQALETIKQILVDVQVERKYITEQTAVCLLALIDTCKGRANLLPSKRTLRDGARIHDLMEFSRADLSRPVAENTRESWRKTSLKPLQRVGILLQHKNATNDPKTHYAIAPDFQAILDARDATKRNALIERWKNAHKTRLATVAALDSSGSVVVNFGSRCVTMSKGKHNNLVKAIVEVFAPSFAGLVDVLYIGDTADKMLYTDDQMLASLGITLDIHDKLPDVMFFSPDLGSIVIVESVTSVGPISEPRRSEIVEILERNQPLRNRLLLVSAFPDRVTFRRFVTEIASESDVWIADEPDDIIRFDKLSNLTTLPML